MRVGPAQSEQRGSWSAACADRSSVSLALDPARIAVVGASDSLGPTDRRRRLTPLLAGP